MDQPLPLANIVTLGVRDFNQEREFYRRLGWPHAFDSDNFTVFELRGAILALFSDKWRLGQVQREHPGIMLEPLIAG